MIEERIRKDLTGALKGRDSERLGTLKMILGEIPRLNKKANEKATDKEIEGIIKKLIKSEKLVLGYSGKDVSASTYISILEEYLPKNMTEEEIKQWVLDNIDFNAYNSATQAMGKVMKELAGKVDGNIVKKILTGFKL